MTVLLTLLLALAAQDSAPAPPAGEAPIPDKVVAEATREEPPTVSIRTEGNGDRVEEYRQNGRIYMVKVTPSRGPAYYLMDTDGNGKLNRDDRDPRVSPVHWTIYEWD
jgi:hypothetical protein